LREDLNGEAGPKSAGLGASRCPDKFFAGKILVEGKIPVDRAEIYIFAREEERQHSLLADLALGIVAGFGPESYLLAFDALVGHLERRGS